METRELKPGDIIVFPGAQVANGPRDIMGLVTEAIPTGNPRIASAVFVQFYGIDASPHGPVHYFHHELNTLQAQGDIRITYGD